ncbi:MAG: phosphoenolpyruvate synthase [Candidatus Roizmanbacteria bacterium]
MNTHKYIVWFEQVGKNDVGLVGGKGANLGEMTNAHLPVPYGFVVTSHAYFYFVKEANLMPKIKDIISITNVDNQSELHQASTQIRELILKAPVPEDLSNAILDYYEELPLKEEQYFKKQLSGLETGMHKLKGLYHDPLVAVRSSATAEDLPDASFAGQQETYLNVKGDVHLLHKVKECWASLFTERAIYYRTEKKFDHFQVGLAAVVQRMVQSVKSGIAFSIDPVTNDKNKIVIESIFGLGEYIVQGKVTPDHYEVDKRSFVVLKKDIKYQNLKFIKAGVDNKEVRLDKKEGSMQKLSSDEILNVAVLVKDIENHYYFPQDIEWAIENNRVFIVQSRPITTIKTTDEKRALSEGKTENMIPIATGAPASPGIGIGAVKIIHSPTEIDKVSKGDVLVAPQTNPDYVPAMKRASAIVTEMGGRTSHAAIVSRELGIPAVVGVEHITKLLKNDQIISVNGATGEIFKGSILSPSQQKHLHEHDHDKKVHHKTETHVYVNLAEPEIAENVAKLDVDGIGLLRAEFMIAGIGRHPMDFIKQGEQKDFVHKLTHELERFVKPFSPRQVVYRATDFKTNEYRNLEGGKAYEPHEENPMLGYRGASRYIDNPEVFKMELAAIREIWNKGYTNLHIMIPFVRAPWEMVKIKSIIEQEGLLALPGFKLWMMVEVPSSALALEEFLKIGIDGVSIGTNDLTMMLMGVDRDNQKVANVYDERTPIVVSVLEYIVKTCRAHGVTCSICGQAASDYPDLVAKLVQAGITSVSVNPDAVDRTRDMIFKIEKELSK